MWLRTLLKPNHTVLLQPLRRLCFMDNSEVVSSKRIKLDNMKIGTHNGVFHCDEIFACYMLKALPKYKDATIIRSRDAAVLSECDIVVDVGGVYDVDSQRFDHHQRGFAETLSSVAPEHGPQFTIKLSSAGLVYAHYGQQVIRELLKAESGTPELSEDVIRKIYLKVYRSFVEEIDAIDNGVPMFDGEPKYSISTNLSSRVASMNPYWNEEQSDEVAYGRFEQALEMVGTEFRNRINYCALRWWPGREIVQAAIKDRFNVHESGQILDLKQFCPWNEHFFELEAELALDPKPLYVLFADQANGMRVRAVPESATSFVLRKALPERLRGLRDQNLVDLTGIESAMFVHASGFIGGCKTREDALKLAILSLKEEQ